ncbi:metal-dependent hydrolase [Pseudomonas alcaligenes]|uniref:Metal-dependent hydrolase n=1 Tax=Aquipseudomonas alcaligenes TaxID=43263 RepID=A0ABR7RZ34_AQUAC|nr:metal-dependent hydrolase [Pseudomonas alcaligenes]MBC9249737.1 metal-dependent hydrolase [Pseudomonas alcaligenes]
MTSPTPHDLQIKARQPQFDFPQPWLRHWHGDNAFKSHFFDAMSLLFPDGERFFIDSVRLYRDQVSDPRQLEQIRGFIGQEAHHSREHQHYSDALRACDYDLDYLERRLKRRLAFVRKHLPGKMQLAATVSVEHLTAIMADAILQNPDWLRGADPSMARLWRWHALEESEHKAVAFDLYQQVCGNVWLRRRAMLHSTLFFTLDTFKGLVHMLKRDGLLWNWRVWRDGLSWLWGSRGILRPLWRVYCDYFRRDFHPWQHDNLHVIEAYRHEFDAPAEVG